MKIKKILPILLLGSSISPFGVSCFAANKNTLTFVLNYSNNENTNSDFLKLVEKEFNKIKINTNYQNTNFNFKLKSINDNSSKRDLIENGSADFAFITTSSLLENDFYKKVNPKIQTLTTAFAFDKNMSDEYVDGSENDPLRLIANEMQKMSFGLNYEYPFNVWKDDSQAEQPHYDWNGIRYNYFYDETSLVSGYRGMILLSGTDEQINNAIKYWNSKDWNNFRNLGIITGSSTSYGNYKLQENLIRKHFGLSNSWTIAKDKKNNLDKYETDTYGTEKIGKSENYVISFTDEGSFAWTNNISNPNSFRPINNNKIKILTVTNFYPYDIGIFSNSLNNELVDILAQSIRNIYLNNENAYGAGLGYNGYSIINDFDAGVIKPIEEL